MLQISKETAISCLHKKIKIKKIQKVQPGGTGRCFCGVKLSTLRNSLHYHWLHRGMVALFLGCHNSKITWGYSGKLCTSWNCMIIFPLEFLPLPAYKIGITPELHKPNSFFFLVFESDCYQNTASAFPFCCFIASCYIHLQSLSFYYEVL